MAAKKKTTSTKLIKKALKVKKKNKLSDLLKDKRNKRLVIILSVLVIVGIGSYLLRSVFIAAVVGGKPISRLEIVKELEKQGGAQTLDALVTKELIFQEAQKQSISIGSDQVEEEIKKIGEQIEAQGSTLDAALTLQGQTRETFQENIKIQKTVEELLKNEIQVSDEEIEKYFEENKSLYGKDAEYKDLKEDIKQQLTQQKLSEEFQTWIEKLKSESQIIYFVNY